MTSSRRALFSLILAWAILFVPFAHSAGMIAHEAAPASTEHHHGPAASHDHGQAMGDCHEDAAPADQAPATSDPCSMCQSHPVCHMVVLTETVFELPVPGAPSFEIGGSPTAFVLAFKPPLTPPRA